MPQFLKSKHQKLILQCYPSGRDIDKKPNSSELSYLLYYASTRRVKLEKVGNFIEKKTISDLRHYSRYGNVQVSLFIIKNLIEKCADNLNVFANNVAIIFKETLLSNDLILAQLTLKVFKVFCENLDNNLFIGDREFVDNFTEACELFLDIGAKNYKAQNLEITNNQWQIISIKAAKYLSSIAGFNLSKNSTGASNKVLSLEGDYLVNKSFDLILSILKTNFSLDDLLEKLSIIEQRTHRRTPTANNELATTRSNVTMRRSLSISRLSNAGDNLRDNTTEDNINLDSEWTNLDCAEDALVSLKSYFKTSISYELHSSMNSINNFFYYRQDEDIKEWATLLIQIIVNWVPVQLRYLVLTFLINRLLKISNLKLSAITAPNGANVISPSAKDLSYQITLTCIISGLLNSKVNMIGLSILDILKNLLSLQSNLVLLNARDPDNNAIYSILAENYIDCISNLSQHIYYHDQISDIIEEILIRINETFLYNLNLPNEKISEKQIIILFTNIDRVLYNGISKSDELVSDEAIEIYGKPILEDEVAKKNQQQLFALIKQKVSFFVITWLNFSSYLNHDHFSKNKPLLLEYYKILIKLLSIEAGFEEEHTIQKLLSNEYFDFDDINFTKKQHLSKFPAFKSELPNFSNLILNNASESANFLDELLRNFDNILNLVDSSGVAPEQTTTLDDQLLKYLLVVKGFVLEIFGINFIYNGLHYFLSWQFKDIQDFDDSSLLKDSFGYKMLLQSIRYLDSKCQQDKSFFQEDHNPFNSFLDAIVAKVNARIQGNAWNKKIPVNDNALKDAGNIFSSNLIFSKQDLLDFFNQSKFTNRWVVEVLSGENRGSQDQSFANGNNADTSATNGNGLNPGSNGFENSSVLSSSKLIANLTNNNTILSANITGILNGRASFFDESNVNNNTVSNSWKAHDLKKVVSRNQLAAKDSSNAETPANGPPEEVVDELKKLLTGLKFNNEEFMTGKISIEV